MKASDIMTRPVVTVAPDTPVQRIAALLLERRISAVPVTHEGSVVGIVSEGDLMQRPENATERGHSWWLETFTDSETLARDYAKTHGRRAIDVMTRPVISIGEETEIGEIARLLDARRIKRVPVVREGKLVGIVSRADLLRALVASWPAPMRAAEASDRDLHDEILRRARAEPWSDVLMLTVAVHSGEVDLSGVVPSEDQRHALRVLVESVPGVKSVHDRVTVLRHWAYAE